MKYTNEEWIIACIKRYGNRFSYESTDYVDSYHKVKVKCIEHDNTFEVSPVSFLRVSTVGDFCPECKHNKKMSKETFMDLVADRYGTRYGIDKIDFKNVGEEITITCYDHGDFIKKPRQIIYGKLREICPKCIEENRKKGFINRIKEFTSDTILGAEPGVFYKLIFTHKKTKIRFLKIGITRITSYERHKCNRDFYIDVYEEIFDTNLNVAIMEDEYKKENKNKRFYLPKYMKFNGWTECYVLDEIQELKSSQTKIIRDSLLLKQNGICPLCKQVVKMPTLDHFHQKKNYGDGLVRGVICNTCNRFAGIIENNLARNSIDPADAPQYIRELAHYLENAKEPFIHPTELPKPLIVRKSCYNKLAKLAKDEKTLPEYRMVEVKGKERRKQKLTKPLRLLFEKYGVTPEFY